MTLTLHIPAAWIDAACGLAFAGGLWFLRRQVAVLRATWAAYREGGRA